MSDSGHREVTNEPTFTKSTDADRGDKVVITKCRDDGVSSSEAAANPSSRTGHVQDNYSAEEGQKMGGTHTRTHTHTQWPAIHVIYIKKEGIS